jgi:hypothetical protein
MTGYISNARVVKGQALYTANFTPSTTTLTTTSQGITSANVLLLCNTNRFIDANNDVKLWSILLEKKLNKSDCLAMIQRAGIELPEMYKLGYQNNNCIGCVKGGMGYWNKIRVDFPEAFDRMVKLEKTIGAKILKSKGERIWLDELPPNSGHYPTEQSIECGIFCQMAEENL